MKKIISLLAALVLCVSLLAGCGCSHEWAEADCVTAKTCTLCQKTEGNPLRHSWKEVDCESARSCTVCGETEGEALGHSWQEADCESARTCTVCAKTEGEPLGHDWQIAGCGLPRTCKVCGITDETVVEHQFTKFLPKYEGWNMTRECIVCHETEIVELDPMVVVYNLLADSKWNATEVVYSDGTAFGMPEGIGITISFDNNFGVIWKDTTGSEFVGKWRFEDSKLLNDMCGYAISFDFDQGSQPVLVLWSTSDPEGDGVMVDVLASDDISLIFLKE